MKEQLPQNIKTPENIQNSQDNNQKENKEINGRINLKLDDKEYELETHSYDFEYPESIQKETGILGYKRTIIKEDVFLTFLKNYSINIGINLDFNQIDDIDKLKLILGNRLNDKKKEMPEYIKTDEGKMANTNNIRMFFIELLDNILSNGEFPNKTFNHITKGYISDSQTRKDMDHYFIQNKFFLQKLFDLDLFSKFNMGARVYSPIQGIVYKTDDKKILEEATLNYFLSPSDIHNRTKEDKNYKDLLKKDEIYIRSYDALNTTTNDFWGSKDNNQNASSPAFGFSIKNNGLFKDYIKKVYLNALNGNQEESITDLAIIQDCYNIFLLQNDELVNFMRDFTKNKDIKNINKDKNNIDFINKSNSMFLKIKKEICSLKIDQNEIIENKMSKYLSKSLETNVSLRHWNKYDYKELIPTQNVNEKPKDIEDLEEDQFFRSYYPFNYNFAKFIIEPNRSRDEIYIPVFINHPTIPQISWGYAKYCHFLNEKGFNFFELKHADHLPKKDLEENI